MSKEKEKALVLPGGGVLGIAWEIGFIAGLGSKRIVLIDADYILGTSAGSVVAVQILTTPIEKLYREQIEGTGAREPVLEGVNVPALDAKHYAVVGSNSDGLEARKIVGAWSLERDRVPETERLAIIKNRLPNHEWPEKPLGITAIQADSGEFKVFDKNSGVSLVDAVAASCSIPEIWPAVTINGKRYYDGGIRSTTNTDMVRGYAKVLVLRVNEYWPEAADVRDISDSSDVFEIGLDEASKGAYGDDPLDPNLRAAVAKAGYEQGAQMADDVRTFWG
jgi:NTE family protein